MSGLRLRFLGIGYSFLLAFVIGGVLAVIPVPHARAATTIVVNSTSDTAADDGVCTLREAITAANSDIASGATGGECAAGSGTDTINFAITGAGVHTIAPGSALPDITEPVTIDGYSQNQTGSVAVPNTAIAPAPLNGSLMIEIDGTNDGGGEILKFTTNSSGSTVKGLVLNRSAGGAIRTNASNLVIVGNYIGTNAAGTAALANTGAGVMSTAPLSAGGTRLGGTSPADRNLISGNGTAGGYPQTGWVVQGNYVGVAKDGVTAIPNSHIGGPGSLSIDDCSNVQIGGTVVGAANVFSGNNSHGLAPYNCPGLHIEGNYIGTDYTGEITVPNQSGIVIGADATGSVIGGTTAAARNIISGNTIGGILSGSPGLKIEGNYVGLNKGGTTAIPNGFGIVVGNDEVVGGGTSARNVVSGNTAFNVAAQGISAPSSGAQISGNYIGTNASGNIDNAITNVQGEGIRMSAYTSKDLIGQSDAVAGSAGNRIAGNRGSGIAIRSIQYTDYGVTATPTNIAILGNEIYGNVAGGAVTGAAGIGIDIYTATAANFGSTPVDVNATTYTEVGPTSNDANDVDTGPNNYMNFPVINSASQNGTALTVNFDLNAADSTDGNYRVEFFANDAADPSGYGEGQTYLGSATVANGTGQIASLTLANGVALTGKVITATTTAINNTTTSGFGATSEFSQAHSIEVVATTTPALANTGVNAWAYGIVILSLIGVGVYLSRGYDWSL